MGNFELEKKKDRMLMRLEIAKLSQHLGKDPWNQVCNAAYESCTSPTVSVVVTLYNYSEYINQCLESVSASEVGSLPGGIEITIVDDCSTDDSAQRVEEYMAQSAVPIVLIKKVFNTGLANSRNIGLDLARAPYVFILDADNWIYPECLAAHYRAIRDSEAVAVYATINRFNTKTGESIGKMSHREWNVSHLVGSPYIDAMAMFDRAIIRKLGGYSMELMEIGWSGWEDYDLWLKLAQAGFTCKFIPQTLSAYRVHPQSMVNTTNQYKLVISRYFTKKFSRLMESHCEFGLAFGFTLEELYANRVESDHAALKEQIEAMESSKFWKIRQSGFKLLRSIGLPVGDSLGEISNQQSSEKLQERLNKMQNSNFWKARTAWFRVKRAIGLAVEDE